MCAWFCTPNMAVMAPSYLLQARTTTRLLESPSTLTNGAVPSSRTTPHLLLFIGRTTLLVTEASVRMTGTDHRGNLTISLPLFPQQLAFGAFPSALLCSTRLTFLTLPKVKVLIDEVQVSLSLYATKPGQDLCLGN